MLQNAPINTLTTSEYTALNNQATTQISPHPYVDVDQNDHIDQDELDDDQKLQLVIDEMYRRSTNLGYGLGVGLGRVLGTRDRDENPIANPNAPARSYYSSVYDYISATIYSLTHCFANSQSQKMEASAAVEGKPQAVILEAKLSKLENAFRGLGGQEYANQLSDHYQTHLQEIENISQLCSAVEKARENGPIKMFILLAHGSPSKVDLGSEVIDIDNFLIHAKSQDLSCLQHLGKDAIVVLGSCDTAHEKEYTFYEGKYTIPMSILKLFALHTQGSTVYAPDFTITKGSLDMTFEPRFNVKAYGDDTGYMGIKVEEANSITDMIYYFMRLEMEYLKTIPRLWGGTTAKELKVISPEHAEFCHEVLPYYAMKKYCDRLSKHPTSADIEKCNTDEQCQELATLFQERLNIKNG